MLTAYFPLESVYAFHEVAEWWTLRRYAIGVVTTPSGERIRPAFAEVPIKVFRDPRAMTAQQGDPGQADAWDCTVYLRTRLRTVDRDAPQQTDVLFRSDGTAWQAVGVDDWTDARGCATRLVRHGKRGAGPWA